ncbi:helix-turn-helix domain-containing protein [Nocardiopsis lambiniae]|uniref:Helix-turn-helix transcriptional regulator n=1 Tax=Nocardiopsis lambiniae TaxID=3075539 RepID=A0ABU2MJM3_9ACTN|nr:helix-turn-helix transcriptional regulator [Nocardiopsis sp. DSM 44743]MDT0332001.1 helix-turn-helix transcriptional regulator [Nocardiopsis sp. DSM 44743]
MTSHSPNIRRRRLGHVLRSLRDKAGLTLEAAAKGSGVPRSTLGRMETAEARRLRHTDLDALADFYEVDTQTREGMHELARQSKQSGWWSRYKDVFGEHALPDWEAEAATIRAFQAQLVPGLFQTPRYAAAVFRGGRAIGEEEVARPVEARMNRQAILNRVKPPRMTAVIDEAALRRLVGGREVMLEQLEHLGHLAMRHNIDIQVLPYEAGEHLGMEGSFTILDFPEPRDTPIVYVGTATTGLFLERPEEIEEYNVAFGNLQGISLSTARSAELIGEIAASLKEQT